MPIVVIKNHENTYLNLCHLEKFYHSIVCQVAVKTPVVNQRNVLIKASIESQASTVHDRPLPLR